MGLSLPYIYRALDQDSRTVANGWAVLLVAVLTYQPSFEPSIRRLNLSTWGHGTLVACPPCCPPCCAPCCAPCCPPCRVSNQTISKKRRAPKTTKTEENWHLIAT
jgi:hypothetical protein